MGSTYLRRKRRLKSRQKVYISESSSSVKKENNNILFEWIIEQWNNWRRKKKN